MTTGTHAEEADGEGLLLAVANYAARRAVGMQGIWPPLAVPCTCMVRVLALVPGPSGCGAKRPGCHLCGHARGAQAAPLWRAALLALLP